MNINPEQFEDIRPYLDEEINPALRRLAAHPYFPQIVTWLFPDKSIREIASTMEAIDTALEFQKQIMHKVIRSIVRKTSAGLTYSGFDKLDRFKAYVFLANHRDILLDSAILQILLVEHGFETSEITFGSNLMTSSFIIDFGKVNRMFTVYRGGTTKQKHHNSMILSEYIRYTITAKKTSIWIAQRGGRTKNGDDKTDTSVLKMLAFSGKDKSFADNFGELNLVPLTISYEYEPCDWLKAQELYNSQDKAYIKKQGEDENSVLTGITQYKGHIHLAVGKPLNDSLEEVEQQPASDRFNMLGSIIDKQVYQDYKLWPVNYIAIDLLSQNENHSKQYTGSQKDEFIRYIDHQLNKLRGERETLKRLLLEIYANPVKNHFNHV